MSIVRAQVVLPGNSGLPRDRHTNNFSFLLPGVEHEAIDMLDIDQALFDFYNLEGPVGVTLGGFLSQNIDRPACHIRYYNMSHPEPRTPFYVWEGFQIIDNGGPALPGEVTLCGSFRGALSSGTNPRRRRGHVKIGPVSDATDVPSSSLINRPTAAFQQRVLDSLRRILNDPRNDTSGVPAPGDFTWGVYSEGARDNTVNGSLRPWDEGYVHPRNRPLLPPLFTPVEHVWVDNEWDTVRSRGSVATGRLSANPE